jgi:hypothetical protein
MRTPLHVKKHATRIHHSNCSEEYGLVLLLVMQLAKLHVKLGNKSMRHSTSYACTSIERHQTTTHWTKPINFNHVQQFHLPQVQNTNDIVCRWDGLTTKMIYSGLVSFDVDSKSPSCEKYYSSKWTKRILLYLHHTMAIFKTVLGKWGHIQI